MVNFKYFISFILGCLASIAVIHFTNIFYRPVNDLEFWIIFLSVSALQAWTTQFPVKFEDD